MKTSRQEKYPRTEEALPETRPAVLPDRQELRRGSSRRERSSVREVLSKEEDGELQEWRDELL